MKTIKRDLSRKLRKIEIDVLGDLHIGDPQCNFKEIKRRIKDIKENRNLYCILNGDIINNGLKSSVSDIYEDTLSPKKQVDLAIELLEPIKHKILAITSGNHEYRTNKEVNLSPLGYIILSLGLKNVYLDEGGVLFLRLGEINGQIATNKNKLRQVLYTFYLTHGSGGGRTYGGKVNQLMQLKSIIDTDIYIHSHTHLPITLPGTRLKVDSRNNSVQESDTLFLNTSATLNYGGYGQRKKYEPLSQKNPIIILDGKKKHFGVKIL